MIILDFDLKKYRWHVRVYYFLDCYYIEDIVKNLSSIGCSQECLIDARKSMEKQELNSGLCYSNPNRRSTIIVIAKTTSKEEFVNSWLHEAKHLLSHMEQEFGIDPYSEEAAYLCGQIGLEMFRTAKMYLCKCYSKTRNKGHL